MLITNVFWLDVNPFLLSGQQPIALLRREGRLSGEVWVADLIPDQPRQFTFTVVNGGDFVRVPVAAHKTNSRMLSAVFGLGIEIGLAAASALREYTRDPVKGTTLILGKECTDLSPAEEALRCYLGVVLHTK